MQKTTTLPQVTSNILTCPDQDSNPGSGARQLAVSGNALDNTAIREGMLTRAKHLTDMLLFLFGL